MRIAYSHLLEGKTDDAGRVETHTQLQEHESATAMLLNELLDVQAAQNAIGVPYLQEILDQREREELPLSDEELFLQAMRGF